MPLSLDYDQMAISEKFILLEELWQSMCFDANQKGFTPEWHLEVLNQREDSIQKAKSTFSDLDDAKSRLQKLV
jgi:hypothetical protein